MVQFDLLSFPHSAHPWGFAIFSFMVVYAPTPGKQKETIPHPRALDRPHIHVFLVHLFESTIDFRTKANDMFSELL